MPSHGCYNTFWYTLVCVLCVFDSMGMKCNFNHLSGHASALIEALKKECSCAGINCVSLDVWHLDTS